MGLRGFINPKDAENIKLTTGNAKLYHTSKHAADVSNVEFSHNTEDFYLDLEGENSEFYELDKEELPKIVSRIRPRPVGVKLVIPPKEYDGDSNIDLDTVVYEFTSTNSDNSGLVEGNEVGNVKGLVLPSTFDCGISRTDMYRSYTFSVVDTNNVYNWYAQTYVKRTPTPARRAKWLPMNYDGSQFNLSINLYSIYHQLLQKNGMIGEIDQSEQLSTIHIESYEDTKISSYIEGSPTRKSFNSGITVQVEKNSLISNQSQLEILGFNLFDQDNISIKVNYDTLVVPDNGYTFDTQLLPQANKLYPLYWKNSPLTVQALQDMTGLPDDRMYSHTFQLQWEHFSNNDAQRLQLVIRDDVNNTTQNVISSENALNTFMIPDTCKEHGYLAIMKTAEDNFHESNARVRNISLTQETLTRFTSDMVSATSFQPYVHKLISVNSSITHINEIPSLLFYVYAINCKIESVYYTPIAMFTSSLMELSASVESADPQHNHVYRKDIPESDFGKLLFTAHSIQYPDNILTNVITSMKVNSPQLVDSDNLTAKNYYIDNIQAVSKLLPRRVSITASIPFAKTWDGTCNFNDLVEFELHNVVNDDDVHINPEYFQCFSVFPDATSAATVIIQPVQGVSPLLGTAANLYTLVSQPEYQSGQIVARQVKLIGELAIFKINNTYGSDNTLEITYRLVDYNNNECEVSCNAEVDFNLCRISVDDFSEVIGTIRSASLKTPSTFIHREGDILKIQLPSGVTLSEDATVVLDVSNIDITGDDSHNIQVMNTTTQLTVKIQHNN